MDVGQMLDHFDHALIKFGYREINGVADLLAKQGSDLKMNEEIFFDVPNLVLEKQMFMDSTTTFIRCTKRPCCIFICLK